MSATEFYFKLPIPLQNLACVLTSYKNRYVRYGGNFNKILSGYVERGLWPADRLAEYRDERIRKLVMHCYETVPHYHAVFNEGGIDPSSIRTLDDLKRLPILDKETVNRDPESFLSSAYKGKPVIHRHTSGTTGSAFRFCMDRDAYMEQWAVCWRYWMNLGIDLFQPHAMFGTRRIASPDQSKPPFWRSKAGQGELYFSAFHESPESMSYYFEEIERRGFDWIHGYPSLVTPLATYMAESGRSFSKEIRYVTLSAENLLTHQRNLMRQAFGVEPRQHYASTEGTVSASEDTEGNMWVDEDFAAMEFVPFGNTTEVLGTSLTNYAMPLLRWRLRDLACCEVTPDGRRKIVSLDGRTEDYLVLPDGRKIGKLDHLFKDTTGFSEVQIRQHADLSVEVLFVPAVADTRRDEESARVLFRESTGDGVPVTFRQVDAIEKTSGGKLRFVVSEVGK